MEHYPWNTLTVSHAMPTKEWQTPEGKRLVLLLQKEQAQYDRLVQQSLKETIFSTLK